MASRALATRTSVRARWFHLAAVGVAGAAIALTDIWTCPFALITGYPCPGCGMTRAAIALAKADFAGAFALHPLSPIVVPVAALLACDWLLAYLSQRPPKLSGKLQRAFELRGDWLWIAAAVLLVGVWAARFFGAFGGPVSVSGWRA